MLHHSEMPEHNIIIPMHSNTHASWICSFCSLLCYKLCTKLNSKAFVSWQSKSCGSISKLMYTIICLLTVHQFVLSVHLVKIIEVFGFLWCTHLMVSINVYGHSNLTFTDTQLGLTHSHTSRFLLWVWMMKGSLHILRRSPWEVKKMV